MEPSLVVIGINCRTAPVAVRERFWIAESRRSDTLTQLVRAEGVDEAIVLSTCNRTEFFLWASELSLAANSVLNFLTREYALKLCEWVNFYRLLDEAALQHLLRVAGGLDSMVLGEAEILDQLTKAWSLAKKASTTGQYLDSVFEKALEVARRVRQQTSVSSATSMSRVAVQQAAQVLGSVRDRKVLVIGAGKMAQGIAGQLVESGARVIGVANRTQQRALELASKLGGVGLGFQHRARLLSQADIVVSAASFSHLALTRTELEPACTNRGSSPLLLIDAAVPRNIDPRARDLPGVFLYDVDDLQQAVQREGGARQTSAAETIITSEAKDFNRKLHEERAIPDMHALHLRLEQIGREELQKFRKESGPFTHEYDKVLQALTTRMIHRISAMLAREPKAGLKAEQDTASPAQNLAQSVKAGSDR